MAKQHASKHSSKPQKHRADANKRSPSEYVAKRDPKAKPGDWQGRYVPLTPKQKEAQAVLAKMNAPLSY
jgi:hypothetical protein